MIAKEELQKMNKKQLEQALAEYREQLRSMRFKVAANQLNQVHKIAIVRKTIAQILTKLQKEATNS